MASQNLISPDDEEAMFRSVEKEVARIKKDMGDVEKSSEGVKKNFADAAASMGASSGRPGGGKLGLGTMSAAFGSLSTGQKVGLAGIASASIGMSMAPNTMSAVAQRMYADSVAGLSGMKANQVISQSNRLVNGATSAGGPTAAAANLFYQGGYTASSLSSKNIMSSIGGLSAITGGSNEQVASSLAGINGMGFLRGGIRIRDNQGNLLPINQIVNSVYTVLYGGRKVTQQQAAMLLNPNSKGYQTLMMLTGGDTNLMQTIAMAVITRATKGSALTKKDLGSANQALNAMGVEGNSPIRANFKFNNSENALLQNTQSGLVNGYNLSLNTVAAVNQGLADLAKALGPVTYGLMSMKGMLQTFPSAGNVGGTLSGIGSMGMGIGSQVLSDALMAKTFKSMGMGGGFGGGMGGGTGGGPIGPLMANGSFTSGGRLSNMFGGRLSKLFGGGGFGMKAGVGAMAMQLMQSLANSTSLAKNHPGVRKTGNVLADMGKDALIGTSIGALFGGVGAPIGAVLGSGAGLLEGLFSGGPSNGSGGNGNTGGSGGGASAMSMPVPSGTPITSPYGNRPGGHGVKPGFHPGIDYGTAVGTHITASADGVVTQIGNDKAGWGNYITIDHGGVSTRYAHLSQVLVRMGQHVKRGQIIGKSGGLKGAAGSGNSTGPHLHAEVIRGGKTVNPQGFFGKTGSFLSSLWKDGLNFAKGAVGFLTGNRQARNNAFGNITNPFSAFFSNSQASGITNSMSSPALTSLLNGDLAKGSAVGYSDIQGWYANHKRSTYLNHDPNALIDNSNDRVLGDTSGMAGGSRKGLIDILRRAGFKGKSLDTAFAIALAESQGRAHAYNGKGRDQSYGLFQINMKNNDPSSPNMGKNRLKQFHIQRNSDLFNPEVNAKAAYEVSTKGTWFKPWATYNNGNFLKYIDDAHRAEGQGGPSGMPMAPSSSTKDLGTKHHNVSVNVQMHVNIARSSTQEAEAMFVHFQKKLETALRKNEVMIY